MGRDYIPKTDLALLGWANRLANLLDEGAGSLGVPVEMAERYRVAADAYAEAMSVATNRQTRGLSSVFHKNEMRRELVEQSRAIARIVQASPTVLDEQRLAAGLPIRKKTHSPIGVPESAPRVRVESREGTWVTIRLYSLETSRRARLAGTQGMVVMSHIGDAPPMDGSEWRLVANVTRAIATVDFPPTTKPGTLVWLRAAYYNPRGQRGPWSDPVSTYIAGGAIALPQRTLSQAA